MSDPVGGPVATAVAGPGDTGRRGQVLRELRVAAALLSAGLVVGAVWALAAPSLAHAATLGESRVAVDGLLALLGAGAGLLTAVLVMVVPGPRPALRLGVVLVASAVAALLALPVGATRGLSVGAPGVVLVWPLVTAALTALRTLGALVLDPDGVRGSRPRHAGAQEHAGAGPAPH